MSQLDRMAAYNDRENKKYHLKKVITKRVTTAFIAALAEFERVFGQEFGLGVSPSERSPEQIRLCEAYKVLRTIVLDRGNQQARGAQDDLHTFFSEDK